MQAGAANAKPPSYIFREDPMISVKNKWWRKLNGFDLFVIAGGTVNLLVIFYLIGYWLLH